MSERIGIVGAGIVGLAHAWSAAKRGHRVTVFERSRKAQGASIRNFGMIWPIGQAHGEPYQTAMHSRQLWLEASQSAGFWCDPVGSIHLAYREDEAEVLKEFAEIAPKQGCACQWLSAEQVVSKSAAVRQNNLQGGLWSETEHCVDPREALPSLAQWLAHSHDVELRFNVTIKEIDGTTAIDAQGRRWPMDRLLVCSGADFATLFPDVFQKAELRHCKLQMLRTEPQPPQWRLGPHLAGGLTLRHYKNFEICSSLPTLKARIAQESPELDRYGIHVMASQNRQGEVILGDSHEYGEAIEPFDKVEIDELMLRELRRFLVLPTWTLKERWHGIYAKHPTDVQYVANPSEGVTIVTATGGAGMTMSFGLAERFWQ